MAQNIKLRKKLSKMLNVDLKTIDLMIKVWIICADVLRVGFFLALSVQMFAINDMRTCADYLQIQAAPRYTLMINYTNSTDTYKVGFYPEAYEVTPEEIYINRNDTFRYEILNYRKALNPDKMLKIFVQE